MKIFTESGSRYDVVDGWLCRTPASEQTGKRRDGEWVRLLGMVPATPVVGSPVHFVLEPLGDGAEYTVRMATVVVRVED